MVPPQAHLKAYVCSLTVSIALSELAEPAVPAIFDHAPTLYPPVCISTEDLVLQSQLEGVAQSVQGHLAALDEGLARRLAIAAARSLLQLMHDTAHVLSKVCAPFQPEIGMYVNLVPVASVSAVEHSRLKAGLCI